MLAVPIKQPLTDGSNRISKCFEVVLNIDEWWAIVDSARLTFVILIEYMTNLLG